MEENKDQLENYPGSNITNKQFTIIFSLVTAFAVAGLVFLFVGIFVSEQTGTDPLFFMIPSALLILFVTFVFCIVSFKKFAWPDKKELISITGIAAFIVSALIALIYFSIQNIDWDLWSILFLAILPSLLSTSIGMIIGVLLLNHGSKNLHSPIVFLLLGIIIGIFIPFFEFLMFQNVADNIFYIY